MAGLLGETSCSMVESRRERAAASASPQRESGERDAHALGHQTVHDAALIRTQRHADAHLAPPLRNRETQDTMDPDQREHDANGRECTTSTAVKRCGAIDRATVCVTGSMPKARSPDRDRGKAPGVGPRDAPRRRAHGP